MSTWNEIKGLARTADKRIGHEGAQYRQTRPTRKARFWHAGDFAADPEQPKPQAIPKALKQRHSTDDEAPTIEQHSVLERPLESLAKAQQFA